LELLVDGSGGNQVQRVFRDKNGNVVRMLTAGTGSALTLTHVATGAAVSSDSNGAVADVTVNPDRSSIWVTTGHNVLILFPTATPVGPSTTLYVGPVVFAVDTSFNFALRQHNRQATDICAAFVPMTSVRWRALCPLLACCVRGVRQSLGHCS
jgi:hypothetical protein